MMSTRLTRRAALTTGSGVVLALTSGSRAFAQSASTPVATPAAATPIAALPEPETTANRRYRIDNQTSLDLYASWFADVDDAARFFTLYTSPNSPLGGSDRNDDAQTISAITTANGTQILLREFPAADGLPTLVVGGAHREHVVWTLSLRQTEGDSRLVELTDLLDELSTRELTTISVTINDLGFREGGLWDLLPTAEELGGDTQLLAEDSAGTLPEDALAN